MTATPVLPKNNFRWPGTMGGYGYRLAWHGLRSYTELRNRPDRNNNAAPLKNYFLGSSGKVLKYWDGTQWVVLASS